MPSSISRIAKQHRAYKYDEHALPTKYAPESSNKNNNELGNKTHKKTTEKTSQTQRDREIERHFLSAHNL